MAAVEQVVALGAFGSDGKAVEVGDASVAPDCALTRPKRLYGNATHRNCPQLS